MNIVLRRTIFDLFPAELWLYIKSHFSEWDLLTHVAFSLISESLTEFLYGDEDEEAAFWEALCFKNGLGVLPEEAANSVSWKPVALDRMMDAFRCKHPACGVARLRVNGMCSFILHFKQKSDCTCISARNGRGSKPFLAAVRASGNVLPRHLLRRCPRYEFCPIARPVPQSYHWLVVLLRRYLEV